MSYVIITLDDGTEQMYLEINCSCFKQQTDSYKVYTLFILSKDKVYKDIEAEI